MTNLFIDAEWFRNQHIFLLGYAYRISDFDQLYDNRLNKNSIASIFLPVDGFVFCWGPDIGMIEKNIGLTIRKAKRCVNLIAVAKYYLDYAESYKLRHFEEIYELERKHSEYKDNIFNIWHDWTNPLMKKNIIAYNKEDVLNMVRIYKGLKRDFNISEKDLEMFLMK